jgi:predicted AAA+ superfamily ATPase
MYFCLKIDKSMERIITQKLINWKNGYNRKPLIVRGARQVGKSYAIVDFGRNYFEGETHVLNFEKSPELNKVFEYDFDVNRILSEFEIHLNKRINKGVDLLFFDEIQACPKAIIALRYFYEQMPEMHLIAAGSLLEFALQDISFPVGRVQLLNMHPMNFYEYLLATDKLLLAETILKKPQKLADSIHDLLKEELKKYFVIGGMPECVKTFIETKSLTSVIDVQTDLIETFRQDFSKYSKYSDKQCLNSVLTSVAKNIGHQIKYSNLAEDFSNPTIKKSFVLLETARLFKKVYSANPNGVPLGANIAEKTFKTVLLDIGLFSRMNGFTSSLDYNKTDLLSIFRGAMAEQFVGQELLSAGHEDLYYWSRQAKSSTAEVDFLIENHNRIIPIEVKSGAAGKLRSMHLLLNSYPNVQNGFVFSDAGFGEISEQKLVFMPLYFVYASASQSVEIDPDL